eukprot:869145_1
MAQAKVSVTEETAEKLETVTNTVVYSWGTGRPGELGHDNVDKSQNCLLPSTITYFTKHAINISCIACGEGYSCAITSNGDLYTWGMSYKLGIGPTNTNPRQPVLVQYFVDNKQKIEKKYLAVNAIWVRSQRYIDNDENALTSSFSSYYRK